MEIRTILVEPKLEENIGAVARAIKNFGFSELYLVNPPAIGEKAMAVASHAYDVLRACEKVNSVEEAIEDSTIVAGTTSRHHLRMPFFSPRELKDKVKGIGKSSILSILFGSEDTGLRREELMLCDLVVCIPTSSGYPVMNLSHAVAVVLYELSEVDGGMAAGTVKLASIEDKERLFMHMKTFLDEIGYKEHKKDKTMLMLRRILGRAELTEREVQTLRGILRKAEWKISKES
ncbi:MAG: RNA methyltransferase [Methanophagales archaeon]|nr:RNA methyltransferase [Methanophagales archaeon]